MRIVSRFLSVSFLGLVLACSNDRTVVPTASLDAAVKRTNADRVMTSAEYSLRSRILAALDPRGRPDMERLLDSGRPLRMYSKPAVDTLLQELFRMRVQKLQATAAGPATVPALVVLVDSLPLPDSRAVVVRRVDLEPRDVVLLLRTASVSDFYAGCATLTKMRKRDGDVPTRNLVASVRLRASRRSWGGRSDAVAQHLLDNLRDAQAATLPGIGRGQSTLIDFAPTGK